jgi:hypothetical protein
MDPKKAGNKTGRSGDLSELEKKQTHKQNKQNKTNKWEGIEFTLGRSSTCCARQYRKKSTLPTRYAANKHINVD